MLLRVVHLCTFLAIVQPGLTWGELGHRTVGYLAEKYLSENAKTFVDTLLENDQGYDISDAAVWPDYIKRRPGYNHTSIWHYMDAKDKPPSLCGIKYPEDCNDKGIGGCIVSAIINQTANINNQTLSKRVQKEALMFVIHFLGDIHQPLHIEGAARGGNDIAVCFFNRCAHTNLHEAWDTLIIDKFRGIQSHHTKEDIKEAAKKFAEDLYISSPIGGQIENDCTNIFTAQTCALAWAVGSNRLLCDYVMQDGIDWDNHPVLGEEYYQGATAIVSAQIARAGVRLGAWINGLAEERALLTRSGTDAKNDQRLGEL